jgi:hypothetical protein
LRIAFTYHIWVSGTRKVAIKKTTEGLIRGPTTLNTVFMKYVLGYKVAFSYHVWVCSLSTVATNKTLEGFRRSPTAIYTEVFKTYFKNVRV